MHISELQRLHAMKVRLNFITFIKTVQSIKKSVHVICMYDNNTSYFQYLWWDKSKI